MCNIKSKSKIIFKRLCDVILYLLICFFVFDYFFDYTISPIETVFTSISLDLNISATIILYSGIALFLSWILIEFGGAPINLKSFCYIPTWLIIYIGTILYFYFFKKRHEILIQDVEQSLIIVSVASMFPFTKLVHNIYYYNFLNKGKWDKKVEIVFCRCGKKDVYEDH